MSVDDNERPDSSLRRLWTPWRLKYVAHGAAEEGCIFCNRLAAGDDAKSLIVHRSTNAFVIMNLFPYNTGHVMIVPNRHIADPIDLPSGELAGFTHLLPDTLSALRRVLQPAGFNIGMNIGAVAGAGIADHLHQHVVPRWQGDANFMPILAGAMVVPELINATYAKLRAEFARGTETTQKALLVVLNADADQVLVSETGSLPCIEPAEDEAVGRSAATFLLFHGIDAELAGWAGPSMTNDAGPIALAYLALKDVVPTGRLRWETTKAASQSLPDYHEIAALDRALQLDLSIASAPPG